MEDADTAPTAANLNKADAAADKSRKAKEKEQKQIDFIDKCTIDDVLVDESTPQQLKGRRTGVTAPLQSIKGASPNLLGCTTVRHFMIVNKLQNYRNIRERDTPVVV